MFGFLRRLFFGLMASIAGLSFFLKILLGLALHLYTCYFAFYLKGFFAAFLTFCFPVISQLYWVIVSKGIIGTWYNSMVIFTALYIVLWIILWIIIIISGAASAASYKEND